MPDDSHDVLRDPSVSSKVNDDRGAHMRTERGTGLAGLAFFVTTIGTVITETAGPDITKSPTELTTKLVSDRSLVLINSALHIAAGVAIVFFAAGLATLIAERGDGTVIPRLVLGAGVTSAAASALAAVLAATVASSVHQLHDSQAVYLVYRGEATAASTSMLFFAVLLAAAAIGLTRVELMSRTWTRIGLPVAGVLFVGGFDFLTPDSGPLLRIQTIGGVLALLFVVAVSAALLGAARAGEPARPRVSPDAAAT